MSELTRIFQHSKLLSLILCFLMLISLAGKLSASENTEHNNPASEISLDDSWKVLGSKNYSLIATAIDSIILNNPPQAYTALNAMLEGQLYFTKNNNELYILKEIDDNYIFTNLFTSETLSQDSKRGFKKVRINNRLRTQIRQSLASMQLNNKNAPVRLNAIQELLKDPATESTLLVEKLIDQETDEDVLKAMQTLLAINWLENADETTQMRAIEILANSINPSALNALSRYKPATKALAKKAQAAIKHIKQKRDIYANIETVFFGLSLGSVLALSAIGLAITFGVMGVINMAHGELMMIGAYTTYVIQLIMPNQIGASIIVAIPCAFIVSGLAGIAIERGIIRHLYGRPLETLLATFGVSLILQQTVRSIFSPLNRSVETPQWMSDAWQINEVLGLTWNRFYIIIFCLLVFIALILVMKKTVLGLQVRAVAQNRMMARAMGVRSEWVDALTFGLGSGIAGVAGVALSLLTNVGPNLGQAYIIDSFMVVVFGGVGNLWGTLVAGMSLGVINKLLEPWAGAVLAKILLLIFIILFIQKRPRGLFPQRGRAAED
ncbi:MAG: urea ABC transporter permease subunit UrtB [Gammaproteobacteria bacterium]